MPPILPLILGAASLVGLLAAIHLGAELPVRVTLKGAASVMFVLTALLRPRPEPRYFWLVLMGLIAGLVGDVLLELHGAGTFLAGLVAFLIGHLFYAQAFFRITPPRGWLSPWQLPLGLVVLAVAAQILPRAGGMLLPVILYLAVITAMVCGAVAAWQGAGRTPGFGLLVLTGSLLFYFSDYLVAVNAFLERTFLNTLLLLPAYYAAQFMLAWSVGLAGRSGDDGGS